MFPGCLLLIEKRHFDVRPLLYSRWQACKIWHCRVGEGWTKRGCQLIKTERKRRRGYDFIIIQRKEGRRQGSQQPPKRTRAFQIYCRTKQPCWQKAILARNRRVPKLKRRDNPAVLIPRVLYHYCELRSYSNAANNCSHSHKKRVCE